MRTAKAIFKNGDTITTSINGSDKDIINYYVGKVFNIGSVTDNLVKCVDVVILPEDQEQYFYAPFSEQRRSIRRSWNKLKNKNVSWEEYLNTRELNYLQQLSADKRAALKAELNF